MARTPACLVRDSADDTLVALHDEAAGAAGDVDAALELARRWGGCFPLPGRGETVRRWELLGTCGVVDLTVARIVEPHVDALAILAERVPAVDLAPVDVSPDSTWGVFAAERSDVRVTATRRGGSWYLDGVKPWCSLAARLSHALVTAWVDDSTRACSQSTCATTASPRR